MSAVPLLRCAIYARKSSKEGLEQDFNSLHAQREACEAYIRSQRGEGWRLLRPSGPDDADRYAYDDGGISGGTMDRPGLRRLLADVEAGRVDVVVVYKVARLTRALADFAKLTELFDRHGVLFVSVTQAFNTTTSMGRLTLKVLLSFAQFEREVTAERIRDKIAASKRKGIWMGGNVPLGYSAVDRCLRVLEEEAGSFRRVFETYARTLSLAATKRELDTIGPRTRVRTRADGTRVGDVRFLHGALATILRNRIYVGEIVHKGKAFAGQHEGIIARKQFERVQALLDANGHGGMRRERRTRLAIGDRAANADCAKTQDDNDATGARHLAEPGRLLAGRICDSAGFAMTPTRTNKRGVRYRYYQSVALAQNKQAEAGTPHRVAAHRVEQAPVTTDRGHRTRARLDGAHGDGQGSFCQ